MRQKWMPVKQVGKSKIIIGDFNNTFSVIDRTSKQNIRKTIEDLNIINPIVSTFIEQYT